MFRLILLSFLVVSLWIPPTDAQSVNLDALVAEALEANPSLAVLKNRIATIQTRAAQVGAPPDPVLRFDFVNLPMGSVDFGRTPMSGKQVTLMQAFPFPGSLRAEAVAAEEAVLAAESRLFDHRTRVTEMVRVVYYDLAFYDQAIRITQENESLFESMAERALARYEAGKGRQYDVLQARVALSLLSNRLTGFRASRRVAEVRLNGLLGRSPGAKLSTAAGVHIHTVSVTLPELLSIAQHNSPALRELTHVHREWEARERAAHTNAFPTFSLSLSYRQRAAVAGDPVAGDDFLSAGVGLNLPIFRGRKQLGRAAEARANIRWIEAKTEEERQRISTEVQRILVQLQLHQSEHELFLDNIVPQTQQALLSARSGYEADLVDFSTLLNAQSTWLDAELMRFHHTVAHAKLQAELEALVGLSLRGQDGIADLSEGGKS